MSSGSLFSEGGAIFFVYGLVVRSRSCNTSRSNDRWESHARIVTLSGVSSGSIFMRVFRPGDELLLTECMHREKCAWNSHSEVFVHIKVGAFATPAAQKIGKHVFSPHMVMRRRALIDGNPPYPS